MIKPDFSQPVPADLGVVHFIGIGGSGMSGIARILIGMGHKVTGSDLRDTSNVAALRELGAEIHIGHDAAHLGNPDTVVVTSALWPTNPEYVLAKERGIPVIHRSQALAYLTTKKRLVAVAGAHGDNLFVIEADESDGSFLHYDTAIALITNVDPDHLDHYGSLEAFEQEFAKFARGASEFVAISSDDPGAVRVGAMLPEKKLITFGQAENADVRLATVDASGAQVAFTVTANGQSLDARLRVPGLHNAINAAGALAVLIGLGFEPEPALRAIETFGGTERRFELHGERRGVKVYDDFAHHPTEVAAALSAARAVVGDGKLITVFQPHLYSRTRLMHKEFAAALSVSDQVVVLDIYAAREDPEPGVTGAMVSDSFENQAQVHYVALWDDAPTVAAALAHEGDFIITMGCGDVYRMVPALLSALES
ncbi:MAG: hypothetical protein RI974_138 [Actinomycetota bacterium]